MKQQSNLTLENRWITTGGITAHYLTGGEGKPVILLHGGASCASDEWEPNLAPLAQNYRVYAPDLVGFGDSDKPDTEYALSICIPYRKPSKCNCFYPVLNQPLMTC